MFVMSVEYLAMGKERVGMLGMEGKGRKGLSSG